MDKAGTPYWDSHWASGSLQKAVNPHLPGLRNYVERQFDRYFKNVFAGQDTARMTLLEIGCANSGWLPYFAKSFGFSVSGLDYSDIGCEKERQILKREGVPGSVVCADMFAPPPGMLGAFDVVVSFGVAEHFVDTNGCIRAIASFVKPGGLVITIIPNMAGAVGMVQKAMNRPVFDVHVPLDADMLKVAHEAANCRVRHCDYFLSTNFGVCNLKGVAISSPIGFLKKATLTVLSRASMLAWLMDLRTSKFLSPYVTCVAQTAQ
jgi:2-polyprenyl-3-methyl-5-hydroxy-6-metoxy-1,4-benzoquinol methylase